MAKNTAKQNTTKQNGYLRPLINENLIQLTGTAIHLYKSAECRYFGAYDRNVREQHKNKLS